MQVAATTTTTMLASLLPIGLFLASCVLVWAIWLTVKEEKPSALFLLLLIIFVAVPICWNVITVSVVEFNDAAANLEYYRFEWSNCVDIERTKGMAGSAHREKCAIALQYHQMSDIHKTVEQIMAKGFLYLFFRTSPVQWFQTIADGHFGVQFLFLSMVSILVVAVAGCCCVNWSMHRNHDMHQYPHAYMHTKKAALEQICQKTHADEDPPLQLLPERLQMTNTKKSA